MGSIIRLLLGVGLTVATASVALVGPSSAADGGDQGQSQTRMLLLLDSSGSMAQKAVGGTRIQAARHALLEVIRGLPPTAEVGMRVFGSKVYRRTDPGACQDTDLAVPLGTDNRGALSDAVTAYKPYGETPIPMALEKGADDLGDHGPRSIVLVSDGESTCGDPCPVAKKVSKSGVRLTVNVVGLAVSGTARQQLKCIADSAGGNYYDADSAKEIESTLEHVATRSLRPFTYAGTPIVGGSATSPAPITAGDWTDTLAGHGAKKSYSYQLQDANTTVRFVAYLQDQARSSAAAYVHVYGPNGRLCDYQAPVSQRIFDVRDVLSAQVRIGAGSKQCHQSGTYRFEVYRDPQATAKVPIGLRVIEEPAVVDPGWTTADLEATAHPVAPARGNRASLETGQSFLNAPLVTPGSYRSTIVSGESDLVRVHLDYGQSLRVGVTFPADTPAMQQALDRGTVWDSHAGIALYDPTWTRLPSASGSKNTEFAGMDTAGEPAATRLYDATAPVTSAADGSFTDTGGGTSRAGDYYVGVSMAAADNSVEHPFVLTIAVDGTARPAPTFADGGSSASAQPSASPAPGKPSSSAVAASDDSGTPPALLALLGILILALLGGAGWWWRRRRGAPGGRTGR